MSIQWWIKRIGIAMGTCVFVGAVLGANQPVNLALDKPATFNLKPNQSVPNTRNSALTDGLIPPLDVRDLYDGGLIWSTPDALGWRYYGKGVFEITVDLGKVQPIKGAALTSAGGRGLVTHPVSILVQASEDGEIFVTAGDLVRLDDDGPIPMFGTPSLHTYRTTGLRTKGRYVRFVCVVATSMFVCGEVQVYKGDDAWLAMPAADTQETADQAHSPLRLTQLGVRRRLLQDVRLVREAVEAGGKPASKEQMLDTLDRLEQQAREQVFPQKMNGFKAMWPVNDLDRQIFAVRGQLLAEQGFAPLTLWQTPPYQMLELLAIPQKAADSQISLRMMLNEHRARSFNLTNASTTSTTVKFRLSGLPGGTNPDYVRVFQVEWVDTREGRPRDLALIPITPDDGWYQTEVPGGFTREIWLSFSPVHTAPGRYQGRVEATHGQWTDAMPLELSIVPIRFPDQVDFTFNAWDFVFEKVTNITDGNQLSAKQMFTSHFGNMPWLRLGFWLSRDAKDAFNAQGELTGRMDYSTWDEFVKFWPNAMRYGAYVRVEDSIGPLKLGTPEFDRAIASFAADWAKHNRRLGLKPDQVVVGFGDEPNTPAAFERQVTLSKAFRQGTSDMRIYINPIAQHPDGVLHGSQALQLADIVMPLRTRLDQDQSHGPADSLYARLHGQGKTLWAYLCAGAKQFYDGYYRFQPWALFTYGGDGQGFWALGDSRVHNNWNDYTAYGAEDYSPLYMAPDHVTTTRHWEAVREGIEDWQYLKMLADAGHAREAQAIAGKIYGHILRDYGVWYGMSRQLNPPATLAEQGRLEAIELLLKFKN